MIIDWSDAAVGNPLVDLATWVAWTSGSPGGERGRRGCLGGCVVRDCGRAGPSAPLDDILIVGDAYQVISYDGIIRALEPAMRYTMGAGGGSWFERLEQVASAS